MYSHIIGMNEELWDILEEGVGNLRLDEEGIALDRTAHTAEQKKLYKKHHMIRGILVAALPHKEYLKMSDKSTTKAMFTSLCSNYEGNKKVREAKATMLVHQYELFIMKEDESIETMYSGFQTLVKVRKTSRRKRVELCVSKTSFLFRSRTILQLYYSESFLFINVFLYFPFFLLYFFVNDKRGSSRKYLIKTLSPS